MKTLDLNCDMGEGFGAWEMGDDAALLDHVTSANIACGFHAGDPGTIHRTVKLAIELPSAFECWWTLSVSQLASQMKDALTLIEVQRPLAIA